MQGEGEHSALGERQKKNVRVEKNLEPIKSSGPQRAVGYKEVKGRSPRIIFVLKLKSIQRPGMSYR